MSMIINGEQLVWSYAVKYDSLIPLINKEYSGSDANVINIFIDLTGIYRSIAHQDKVEVNSFSLAASIINLCAHYRNFFDRCYKTYSRFFLIFSNVDDNNSINKKFEPMYTRWVFSSLHYEVNNSITESLNLLDMLTPYLNDIGLYRTKYEFGVKVMDITSHYKDPSIILTKDPYNFQLVSDEDGFVNILYPYKYKGEDNSYIITKRNAVGELCMKHGYEPPSIQINPSVISLILALSRVPERNIVSLFRTPKVIKAISQAISSGIILNEHTVDTDYVCKMLSESKLLDVKDPNYVKMRYQAIDIEYQYMIYMNDPSEEKFKGLVNLYDPLAVKEISMEYFKDYPLDLNVL